MTDRELLEMAAKAAGAIDDRLTDDNAFGLHLDEEGHPYLCSNDGWNYWLPLTDDGDALRLAVKLRLHVDHYPSGVTAWIVNRSDGALNFDEDSADPCADTRRAIVRAAAALGAKQ